MRLPTSLLITALLLSAGLGACSGGDEASDGEGASNGDTGIEVSDQAEAPACDRPVEEPPEVDPVADLPADHEMRSFDDTIIRLHWFPSPDASGDEPAPTILSGPGWSLPGETSPDGAALFGSVGIGALNDRGYNVLTWDPRGFGESEGTVMVGHPDFEGRDVSRIIDWLASLPEVRLDGPGDPRIGMIGSSYGGGIQLAVAPNDCRVDALVPGVAWNSLESSLYLNETMKLGWASGLVIAARDADLDPHVVDAFESGEETGRIDDADIDWFRDRGPGDAVSDITAPTLLVHGTVDTLFPPGESITNHQLLEAAGVPTALAWFCGGHGVCLTSDGATDFIEAATIAWLDRWLLDDENVELPPGFQTVDQDGILWVADSFPDADETITASGEGALELTADGGAGPLPESSGDTLSFLVDGFTPARADNAVEVAIDADLDALLIGAPTVRLSYTGSSPDGPAGTDDRPDRVFAQLVDDSSGHVLGNQITPIPIVLDGEPHEIEIPLEVIAHRITSGHTLRLQIVATTTAYAPPRFGGSIDFDRIEVTLPAATTGVDICGADAAGLGCPLLR